MTDFKFWNTQPVPKLDEDIMENGPIEADKPLEEIRKDPIALPKEFEWCVVDVENDTELKELYTLLSNNYVEDDDASFRFDYTADFLRWALKPPNFHREWHIGVRVSTSKKLVAFISGIPANMRLSENTQPLVEINFLCVLKKLRSKRLAPVLIREVTRRVHLTGIFQAVYTAGVKLPKPIASCTYYHRSLNPKKLIETGFSHLKRNFTMARTIKLYKLPDEPTTKGLRPMKPDDVRHVTRLLNSYLVTFTIAPKFSQEDVAHWLLPVDGVVYSYVVDDKSTGGVSQFASFYALPSQIINNEKYSHINAAYLFYYATKLGVEARFEPAKRTEHEEELKNLMKDLLIFAKQNNFDVFNALTLMDNISFLEELKFGKGDGDLQYYLYNYRLKDLRPMEVGLVML
ncbi:Glycylpeptide N-tetradecanoyltransferase 2 [Nowakowskiella sp. JEL0407]|nr:Glycylpeptide N-tetradecanoyltransferase 2 [Nowakowskiella sp. JEL0407]